MSSLRVLTNHVAKAREVKFLFVELDEVGRPHSVINARDVIGSVENLSLKSVIEVKYGTRSYPAIVLGIGKYIVMYAYIHKYINK